MIPWLCLKLLVACLMLMLQVQATCEFNLATDKSIANTLFLKSDGGNLESTTWWLEPVDGEVKISGPF